MNIFRYYIFFKFKINKNFFLEKINFFLNLIYFCIFNEIKINIILKYDIGFNIYNLLILHL